MKSKWIPALASLTGAMLFFALTVFAEDFKVKKPPASLDSLYRDKGVESKWIEQMRRISGAFDGVRVAAEQKDWTGAEANAGAFLKHYRKAAEWVPEWKDYFDFEAGERFVEAVKTREAARVGEAAKKVAASCDRCHLDNSLAVWVRYTWPETRRIRITDPVEDAEMEYHDYMRVLSKSLRGITYNFEKGDHSRAWKHVFQFKKRLVELRSVCSKCHVSEWTKNGGSVKQFFVGDAVVDAVDRVSKLFATGEPDPQKFWKEIGGIKRHSCRMCHLIHQPAVHIRKAWKKEP